MEVKESSTQGDGPGAMMTIKSLRRHGGTKSTLLTTPAPDVPIQSRWCWVAQGCPLTPLAEGCLVACASCRTARIAGLRVSDPDFALQVRENIRYVATINLTWCYGGTPTRKTHESQWKCTYGVVRQRPALSFMRLY